MVAGCQRQVVSKGMTIDKCLITRLRINWGVGGGRFNRCMNSRLSLTGSTGSRWGQLNFTQNPVCLTDKIQRQ
jgi:hypothetical protein